MCVDQWRVVRVLAGRAVSYVGGMFSKAPAVAYMKYKNAQLRAAGRSDRIVLERVWI